jgi:glucosamine-6-phosphate deaminase
MKIMCALIEDIKPHQIYAAGDLADPHGTHKVCLDSLFEALKRLKSKDLWMIAGCCIVERGMNGSRGEMAVPMSP